MSFFGLKSQIFLKNCEWGIVYFKLKGRNKSLEGRTLAMSVIDDENVELLVNLGRLDVVNVKLHLFDLTSNAVSVACRKACGRRAKKVTFKLMNLKTIYADHKYTKKRGRFIKTLKMNCCFTPVFPKIRSVDHFLSTIIFNLVHQKK
jgi:hypothetical protein